MRLYAGDDLHGNNNYLAILDATGKRLFHRRLPNEKDVVLQTLQPYKKDLAGIAVESTYNWYWFVDALMDDGYKVHLANPSAMQKYTGLKHSDDKHDAFWLAEMLMLGILPQGYIYPKEVRPVRDLLRKRSHLVRLRTSLILSLQNIILRNSGYRMNGSEIKACGKNTVRCFVKGYEHLEQTVGITKETIDFMSGKIKEIEKNLREHIRPTKLFELLRTIPGVGDILGFTILLETGSIGRFKRVGNYVSYCRKVSSQWKSNEKRKGKGNKKNGNKYLAWAFSEAAEHARRYDEQCRAFYNRKSSKKNFMVAHSALAHKLARAAYYIMKDSVRFDPAKLFG